MRELQGEEEVEGEDEVELEHLIVNFIETLYKKRSCSKEGVVFKDKC